MQRTARHIGFLDSIRAVAILAVFAYHSLGAAYLYDQLPWWGWFRGLPDAPGFLALAPVTYGWAGVAVFFVVSGFCIHLSFQRRPHWREFWVRRFFRIYPPYLAALLLFVLVFPFTRLSLHNPMDTMQFGYHLLLLQNIRGATFYTISPAFWSIAVEAQLYLLYPVLLLLVGRFGWKKTILATGVIELILRMVITMFVMRTATGYAATDVPKPLLGLTLGYWFSWSIGAYLAEAYVRQTELPFARWPVWPVAFAAVATGLLKPLSMFTFPCVALLTAVVIARLLVRENPEAKPASLLSAHLAKTGLWSYSIYLLHQPVLMWLGVHCRKHLPPAWNHHSIIFCLLLASWVVIMPFSGLWYRWCELPAIALGKYFTPRGPAVGQIARGEIAA